MVVESCRKKIVYLTRNEPETKCVALHDNVLLEVTNVNNDRLLGQAEQVSIAQVLDVLIIFVMAAIWAFMPSDGFALLTQWFHNKVVQVSTWSYR